MEEERRLTIKDLPAEERPRERLLALGAEKVSNAELLAVILRTGTRSDSALDLAQAILARAGQLRELPYLTVEELMELKGVGPAKAVQVKAALELGRRMVVASRGYNVDITSPEDVFHYMKEEMRYLEQEEFRIILLNIKNKVLGVETVFRGGLNSSIVHPREIFRLALRRSAASMILLHNHPSGDPTPSAEDISITRRLVDAAEIMGVHILDHIVMGEGRFLSFREKGLM
jgi:DNA repair protein RadC